MMKSKNTYLFWYKHLEGNGNFGDELNPYIIERISKEKIKHIDLQYLRDDKWLAMKFLIVAIIEGRLNVRTFFRYLLYNFVLFPDVLLAIGSVLQFNNYSNSIVWGSGIINQESKFKNADFIAVRGKQTQLRLKELGYNVPNVVGDPAILLPLIYKPINTKKYKVGIIPHHIHFEYLKNQSSSDVLVINLLDSIEEVVEQINSCEITFSTSLHGIIVSHVYRIPSLWASFEGCMKNLSGDGVKFKDYFSSVNIEYYQPCLIKKNDIIGEEIFLEKVRNYYDCRLLPDDEIIIKLQRDLLSVTPFTLKEEFI
ncbi:MAG: polysaccharide pyruvyl transferase family protein [Flavobacteriaceae bacterium]|nr:polysaccharide pyruvyl transferase family protein [Flavobacteriaceae bacterium]